MKKSEALMLARVFETGVKFPSNMDELLKKLLIVQRLAKKHHHLAEMDCNGEEWIREQLKADELPAGRIIVRVSKHVVAMIDGVLHDTHDSSRDETRCVYGYWAKA